MGYIPKIYAGHMYGHMVVWSYNGVTDYYYMTIPPNRLFHCVLYSFGMRGPMMESGMHNPLPSRNIQMVLGIARVRFACSRANGKVVFQQIGRKSSVSGIFRGQGRPDRLCPEVDVGDADALVTEFAGDCQPRFAVRVSLIRIEILPTGAAGDRRPPSGQIKIAILRVLVPQSVQLRQPGVGGLPLVDA